MIKQGMIKMVEQIAAIIQKLQNKVESTEFMKRHRVNEKAFVRQRKIKAGDIVYFVLTLMKTTLPFEIMHFTKSGTMPMVAPSSISKARSKLKHTAFEELLDFIANEIPKENKFKGYEVLAMDGMQGELQRTPEIMAKYKTNPKTLYPMFHAVALYDVLNKIFVRASFLPAPTDERRAAIEIVAKLPERPGEILLFDRGFFSLALLKELEKRDKSFVIRVKSNALREISSFNSSDKTDELKLDISYDKCRGAAHKVYNVDLPYSFNIRCVKIMLPNGESETLITNLRNEFSNADIAELYRMRWGIETSYNHLKNAVRIEDFVGVKENSIMQEFYASLFLYNLAILFTDNAQVRYDNKKTTKLSYKINFTKAVATLKCFLARLLYMKSAKSLISHIVDFMTQHLSAIRFGRHFPRRKTVSKHSVHYRNNIAFCFLP